jgi:hypothetical protein
MERLKWEEQIYNKDKIVEAKRELDENLYREEMM